MAKIKVLPDSLSNKIAAGEVVERPSSVVKELLENSLDAGSRSINIEIEAGGKRLIRIVDDGEGMNRDDSILAFERHATSKLRTAEDLESIATLGFRGEALPSIAAVSRLTLRTRTAPESEGTELAFVGGRLEAVRDIAWPCGTEIEVQDLFLNVPARRKFLKSDATESAHIASLVQHYALANPQLSFLLINNGRDVIRVTPALSLKERAYQILGPSLLNKLVEVNREAEGLKVTGFVSNPQEQRSSRDAQYLFINRRFVRDPLIGRALNEAYRSMMPVGTHPAAVLFVDVPPLDVDVNVHPAKTEVRFLHESIVLAFIRDAVAYALRITQPITRVPSATGPRDLNEARIPGFVRTPNRQPFDGSDIIRHQLPVERDSRANAQEASSAPANAAVISNTVNPAITDAIVQPSKRGTAEGPPLSPFEPEVSARESERPAPLPGFGHGIKPLGQIRDSYIVATDEEGLLLVDQHVAHERVLFEQFRDRYLVRTSVVQPLLIPVTLDLSPAEVEAFAVVQGELESMGIETVELSGRTIAIKTAPTGLAAHELCAVVKEVLAVVEREKRAFSMENIRDEIAAELACKAAIKINMPLTVDKMQWLIDELSRTQNPMTCPHGRPIVMRMGLREIERGFKRPV
jgi:DNA mismatch repair protein MutL